MRYYYRQPCDALRQFIGSFYYMDMPEGGEGGVRVEIPHLRFIVSGTSTLAINGDTRSFGPNTALVCGPSFHSGQVAASPDTKIIGASLTPLGWQALFDQSVEPLANRKVVIDELIDNPSRFHAWFEEPSAMDDILFETLEAVIFKSLKPDVDVRSEFFSRTIDRLIHPDSPEIGALLETLGLSHRQVDRLMRYYFGGSPKQVHRVFRALNISTVWAVPFGGMVANLR